LNPGQTRKAEPLWITAVLPVSLPYVSPAVLETAALHKASPQGELPWFASLFDVHIGKVLTSLVYCNNVGRRAFCSQRVTVFLTQNLVLHWRSLAPSVWVRQCKSNRYWGGTDRRQTFEIAVHDQQVGVWCAITAARTVWPTHQHYYLKAEGRHPLWWWVF
jgi:hypothetical protein